MKDNDKCLNCNSIIESDDNFCHNCGHFTTKGYLTLKDKEDISKIENGYVYKQDKKFRLLFVLTFIFFILFITFSLVRKEDLYKPYFNIKKQISNYFYGYDSSIVKTNNNYDNKIINSYSDAVSFIKKDFDEQKIKCQEDIEVTILENELEKKYNIPSVSFCGMSYDEAKKVSDVISEMYSLFRLEKNYLTNITVSNNDLTFDYIAYFQPRYEFVNSNSDINIYNKVNKTQILLNSYYFLNEELLSSSLYDIFKKDWYVKNASIESTIAHEFGHYITFYSLLNEKNVDNITFINKNNEKEINDIIDYFDSGDYSLLIVEESLNNYNIRYNTNLNKNEFALLISNYAASLDDEGNVLDDEIIAEAIHDYYLNKNNASLASMEIVYVIMNKLGE